jgi:adenylate kinase family enzyme
VLVFFVTGVSGAGKSTLARRMAEWGHRAVSTDADVQLCAWTDLDGRRVDRPAEPDAAWLSAHDWRWDPARLDSIITEAAREGADVLWLFGRAANALDVADRFDATFLLEIDQRTMIARMGNPARGNDFGRVGDSLSAAPASHTPFVAGWRRHGATIIDATGHLDAVAQELLLAAAAAALDLNPRRD